MLLSNNSDPNHRKTNLNFYLIVDRNFYHFNLKNMPRYMAQFLINLTRIKNGTTLKMN